MQLARFKFNPLDVRQHPQMNQDMVPTFPTLPQNVSQNFSTKIAAEFFNFILFILYFIF